MGIWEKFKNFINKFVGKSSQNLLSEGQTNNTNNARSDLINRLGETQLSPEQVQMREEELSEKAAYNCLAQMVSKSKFNNQEHRGESMEKTMYRLQAEDFYKDYGHGNEIPVSDNTLRIFVEIQRNYNQLNAICSENKMDLLQVLMKDGKRISMEIENAFTQNKGSFIGFNSDYDEQVNSQIMSNAIKKTLQNYVEEQQKSNY